MTDIIHKLVSEMSTKLCVLEIKPELVEGKKYLILLRSEDNVTQWEIGDYYPERENYMGHGIYEKESAYFSFNCAEWEVDVFSPPVMCWLDLPDPKQIETLLATKPIVE